MDRRNQARQRTSRFEGGTTTYNMVMGFMYCRSIFCNWIFWPVWFKLIKCCYILWRKNVTTPPSNPLCKTSHHQLNNEIGTELDESRWPPIGAERDSSNDSNRGSPTGTFFTYRIRSRGADRRPNVAPGHYCCNCWYKLYVIQRNSRPNDIVTILTMNVKCLLFWVCICK